MSNILFMRINKLNCDTIIDRSYHNYGKILEDYDCDTIPYGKMVINK